MTSCTASGTKLIDGLKRNHPSDGRRCTRAVRRGGGGGHGNGLKAESLLENQRFTDASVFGEESNHSN